MKPITISTLALGVFVFFVVYGFLDQHVWRPPCWEDGCHREGVKVVRVCREHYEETKR